MRGHVFYQGRRSGLAQDPEEEPTEDAPEETPEEEEIEGEPDPDTTVDDELEGAASPEDAVRDESLSELGLEDPEIDTESPSVEDPEKLVQEIEQSPASNWRDYIQPILKDIKQQLGGVSISLLNPQLESDVDVDLGFYITGYVRFLEDPPISVLHQYGDAPVHFKIFVDPEGKLQRSSLHLYTELDYL